MIVFGFHTGSAAIPQTSLKSSVTGFLLELAKSSPLVLAEVKVLELASSEVLGVFVFTDADWLLFTKPSSPTSSNPPADRGSATSPTTGRLAVPPGRAVRCVSISSLPASSVCAFAACAVWPALARGAVKKLAAA